MRQLTQDERKVFEDCQNYTVDNPNRPTRVNIIFHGLLAFRDLDADHYEVLIPTTSDNYHQAKYGNPCLEELQSFPDVPGPCGPGPAYFSFEGILPAPPVSRSFPTATNTVIIKNSLVTPQYTGVRTVIKVPKPLIIRHYRGGETHLTPLACEKDLFTQSVLQRNPDVLHEITVFSYNSFFHPRLVGMGTIPVPADTKLLCRDILKPISYAIRQPDPCLGVLNIGIYSQPTDDCEQADATHFNSMFTVNPNHKLNLQLNPPANSPRIDDGPPLWTSPQIGISFCEMLALRELASDSPFRIFCKICGPKLIEEKGVTLQSLREFLNITMLGGIPGGCGSGFACDDGV